MENKTCKKCNESKPENMFVRSGSQPGTWCKACMVEYNKAYRLAGRSPSPKTETPTKISKTAIDAVLRLENRLRLIARSYTSNALDCDDCFSYVREKLLTSIEAGHNDGYVLMAAKTQAKAWLKQGDIYGHYVSPEPHTQDEDGEAESMFELMPATSSLRPVEEMVEISEEVQNLIATLSPENQKVISMVALGYPQAEIAKELGVSAPAISQRMNSILKACAL